MHKSKRGLSMSNYPTISVIIPAYNMEKYIHECLSSIVDRIDFPDEIIVIDDGSLDNTVLIANRFYTKNSNIKIISINNSGLCGARNHGMNLATGDYIIFIDSDDKLGEKTISHCKDIIKRYNPDIISGRLKFFTKEKSWTAKSYDKVCQPSRLTTFENDTDLVHCMNIGTKCFRRNFIKDISLYFAEGLMMTEDHWFSLNAFSMASSIYITDHIMFYYRRDRYESSTVTNKLSYYKDIYSIQKKLADANIKCNKAYYFRFLNFDLKRYAIDIIQTLKLKEQYKASKYIEDTINIIPDCFLTDEFKKMKKIPFLSIYILTKQNIKHMLNIIKKISYRAFNKLYLKLRKYRLFILKIMYCFLCLHPINKNKILFLVRSSTGMSNMQDIYNLLKQDSSKKLKIIKAGQTSLANDFRIMREIAKAKIMFIDGDYYFLFGITPRKGSFVIQLWHAAGVFKKFGCDIYRKGTLDYKIQREHHRSYSYAITSSPYVNKFYASAFSMDINKIKPLGISRIDRLFHLDIEQIREKIYSKYSLDNRKKIILYAPTFREPKGAFKNIGDFNLNLDIEKFIKHFSNDYYLALRIHPNYRISTYDNILNFTSIPQEEALAVSDILITDYSSIIFDYSYFRRPIFFYHYDLQNYILQRSFYEKLNTSLPGKIVFTEDELIESIKNIKDNTYNSNDFWNKYMESCTGKSTENIVNFINSL